MPTPTVHSNAFNFLSAVQAGVDPRTGQYSCSISLPELKANHLCGPILPLTLGFSAMSSRDSGFGKGWSLQLSHFDPVTRILSLATGETFRIEGTAAQPTVPERKIDSFHFFIESDRRYRVVHKSGVVEILTVGVGDRQAWVTEVHSAEGHRVTLGYEQVSGTLALQSVRDEYDVLLTVDRGSALQIKVNLHPGRGPGGAPLASFILGLNNREVTSISLPTVEQAGWRFVYESIHEYLCIKDLQTPLGGHELITYDSQGHEFPGNLYPSLPRVARHEQRPGFGQPPIQVRYTYTNANFLGFGAPGLIWDDDGLDNLYRAQPTYTYSSTETLYAGEQPVRTTARTFNYFHLLTEETVTQNDNVLSTRTTYHSQPGVPFPQQPAQCQLPDTVLKIWYLKSASSQTHEETTRTTFDDYGNLTEQLNPDGTRETNRYYPAEGDDGCPADPHGFVRTLRDKTITPAAGAPGAAPVLRTAWRYALQTGVGGGSASPWLAISEESLQQMQGQTPTELQHTTFTYINQPLDRYQHGRKLKETQTLNGQATITDYAYQRSRNARAGETVQHTLISLSTDFDAVEKSYALQHSLLNGQPLLNRDDNDVQIAYRYDALGRVLEETVAPGTEFEASRRYEYLLSARLGQQAEQTAINVKGVKTRTLLDGANRVIEEYRQGADEANPEQYLRTYNARYDNRGLLVEDSVHDWLHQQDLVLTSTYEYDDWGEQRSVTGPDGVVRISENNPIKQTSRSWLQSPDEPPRISNMSETKSNRFGKPEWSKTLDATGDLLGQNDYFYDGLGRCLLQTDALRRSTQFSYDAWSRLIKTTLPDQTEVGKDYAPHTDSALPVSVNVKAVGMVESVVIGRQRYDGLDRMTQAQVGPRITHYRYKDGQLQIDECITADNHSIHYEYRPGLTDQPVSTVTDDEQADFTYDVKTAYMTASENTHGRAEFDYDLSGQLKSERRIENGTTWETLYVNSPGGRPLSRTDATGLETAYEYDATGRVKSVKQGQLQAEFDYSSLGQLIRTLTTDVGSGSALETRLEYDDQGREVLRTLNLAGHDSHRISQTWREDNKLTSRHLQAGARSLLNETFDYDTRGRLTLHRCAGERLPQDRYGNAIVTQRFDFDALDNITQATSEFQDGSQDLAMFTFADNDPTQLVGVTHTHAAYPTTISLDYDANGNLLHDEHLQRLVYDSQSRLLTVSTAEGDVSGQYRYDAHNYLSAVQTGSAPETLRFYQGNRLSNTLQGSRKISYLYDGDQPLGQQELGDAGQTTLFLSDAKQSVLGESQQADLRTAVYSAYGERPADNGLRSLLAFNGEVRDELSGWYLLGKGYRAYNPSLMRFHSPDSLSPFGAGGLNPYVYCLGDPIGLVDPTGHLSKLGALLLNIGGLVAGMVGVVMTGGLVAPALTLQFALFATTVGTGVGAAVTGGIGAFTPDQHAKKVLGVTSAVLGAISLLSGSSMLLTGNSRLPGRFGFGNKVDDVVDATTQIPTPQATPRSSIADATPSAPVSSPRATTEIASQTSDAIDDYLYGGNFTFKENPLYGRTQSWTGSSRPTPPTPPASPSPSAQASQVTVRRVPGTNTSSQQSTSVNPIVRADTSASAVSAPKKLTNNVMLTELERFNIAANNKHGTMLTNGKQNVTMIETLMKQIRRQPL